MIPRDEGGSVVWTDEMREAYAVAAPLLEEDGPIPARMAFLERYRALVQAARDAGTPTRWEASLGYDVRGRESVVLDAVAKGRIAQDHAMKLLPHRDQVAAEKLDAPQIEDRSAPGRGRLEFQRLLANLKFKDFA